MLYELLADERADVRMIEESVEGGLQILLWRLTGTGCQAVEQNFRTAVMLAGKWHHGAVEIQRIDPGRGCAGERRRGPTGKDRGKALDHCLIIGRDRGSACVQLL